MSTGRFKKIWDRNDLELEATIARAIEECDKLVPEPNGGKELFYTILAGVDAYFEKRIRKEAGINYRSQPQLLLAVEQLIIEEENR